MMSPGIINQIIRKRVAEATYLGSKDATHNETYWTTKDAIYYTIDRSIEIVIYEATIDAINDFIWEL